MNASFLTGPVTVRPEVRAAFAAPAVPHRDPAFLETMRKTRLMLTSLVNLPHVAVIIGSGTLANDAVGAQLTDIEGSGLILSNGEFGERLIDHARRWNLRFSVARRSWGNGFEWNQVRQLAERCRPAWIWAVLAETSTGVINPLTELRSLSEHTGAVLCLDAVSAIGLMPLDLTGVRFATAVSGKGMAAYPGLAAVFHDGRLARSERVPRYLDLEVYEGADGVPFTHSSNLLAALECSLALTNWSLKFDMVKQKSRALRAALREKSMRPVAREEDAAPGIITLAIPAEVSAAHVASALANDGITVAHQSRYLVERNWLQIALMGEIDEEAIGALPGLLAGHVEQLTRRPEADRGSLLPRIVADAIDGGACWLTTQRTRKYRRP